MQHPHAIRLSFRILSWAALLAAPTLLGATGCKGNHRGDGSGISCMSSDDCAAATFCKFGLDAVCGAGDQTGTCEPIPAACTQDFTPVCGCDGMNYANACAANAAGASVASRGECGPVVTPAGASADSCSAQNSSCGAGKYCHFTVAENCGLGGEAGTCELEPNSCTGEIVPVCGCDRETYNNECLARAAGASVWSLGACPGLGDACSAVGPSCGVGQFCSFSIADGCGNSPGVCEAIPEMCNQEFLPVCACNRTTYNNECLAHAAGVSVAGPGACP